MLASFDWWAEMLFHDSAKKHTHKKYEATDNEGKKRGDRFIHKYHALFTLAGFLSLLTLNYGWIQVSFTFQLGGPTEDNSRQSLPLSVTNSDLSSTIRFGAEATWISWGESRRFSKRLGMKWLVEIRAGKWGMNYLHCACFLTALTGEAVLENKIDILRFPSLDEIFVQNQ